MKGGTMPRMFDLMKQAMQMKREAGKIQQELVAHTYEATSADEKIKVTVNGKMEIISLKISPDAFTSTEPQKLERNIKDTINEAIGKAQRNISEIMKSKVPDLPI